MRAEGVVRHRSGRGGGAPCDRLRSRMRCTRGRAGLERRRAGGDGHGPAATGVGRPRRNDGGLARYRSGRPATSDRPPRRSGAGPHATRGRADTAHDRATRARSPDEDARAHVTLPLPYQSGSATIRHRGAAGALPVGRNSPQRCPTACTPSSSPVRPSPRREATTALVALSHPPAVAHGPFEALRGGSGGARGPGSARLAGAVCAGTRCDAGPADRLRGRPGRHGRQWRPGGPGRRLGADVRRQPLDGRPARSYGRRRRAAAGSRSRAGCGSRRSSACWSRARRRSRCAARPALSRRAARRRGARLRVREPRRALPPARAGADRRQRPGQRARLPRAGAPTRTATSLASWSPSSWAGCGGAPMDHSPFDVVAGTATWRPASTTCGASTHRLDSYDHPDRRSSSCCSRRRTPPAWGASTSSCSRRASGMQDTFRPPWFHRNWRASSWAWCRALRRQGRGLRPGRRQPAQLHERTGRTPRPSSAPARGLCRSPTSSATRWPSCSRRHVLHAHALRARVAATAARLLALWSGLGRRFEPQRR
jgi:hypothetical protein